MKERGTIMSDRYIDRFSTSERVLHWFVTITFFSLLLSGLGLYSRLFTGYFNLFGNGSNAIFVHKVCGVLFFVSSLLFFMQNRARVTDFNEDDREWFRHMGGYLSHDEIKLKVGNGRGDGGGVKDRCPVGKRQISGNQG